jgi:hypothetical protein
MVGMFRLANSANSEVNGLILFTASAYDGFGVGRVFSRKEGLASVLRLEPNHYRFDWAALLLYFLGVSIVDESGESN